MKTLEHGGRDDARWVSVWAGRCSDESEFSQAMLMGYDEDGEGIPSPFSSAFDTEYIDEDLVEYFTFTATHEISSALAGSSDEQKLISTLRRNGLTQFGELANCAVLVYHFRHDAASGIRRTFSSVELTFMGAFKVEELYHGEP